MAAESDQSTPEAPTPGQRLPSRRPHPKTRSGCKTCKRRKIKRVCIHVALPAPFSRTTQKRLERKNRWETCTSLSKSRHCDETIPSCRNCIRHAVPCDFLLRQPQPRPQPQPAVGLNMLDLELMYNYTSSTHATLSWIPTLRQFWKEVPVRVGLECEYVMRTALAISALHTARHRPDKKDFYIEAALTHHEAASRQAMDLMSDQDLSIQNSRNLFLFSSLTIFFALGAPRGNPNGTLLLEETAFPNWLFLLRGAISFVKISGKECKVGFFSPLFEYSGSRYRLTHPPSSGTLGPPWPQTKDQEMLEDLEQLIKSHVSDAESLEAYLHAIRELRSMYQVFYDLTARMDTIDALIWVSEVVGGFLDRLAMPTQEAVAIFVHYSVLLKRHDSCIWLEGWADHLLSRAYGMLDAVHRTWIAPAIEDVGWLPPS